MDPRELPLHIRRTIVQEIERWEKDGQITAALADKLRRGYDFDFNPHPPVKTPLAPQPTNPQPPVVAIPNPPASQPVQIQVDKPRHTLAQTLLSETSIRIALYLGAFFVISAALILAVLVVTLRLPILVIVTILFAAGALALKRRLPQPSFILYLVFSALLPITGGVLADLLGLTGKAATEYWIFLLLGMAVVWAFSIRLYISRFFSLTAMLAFDAALIMTGRLLDQPPLMLFLFLLTFSSLAALAMTFILKSWRGNSLAMPVFILAQVQQVLTLGMAFFLLIDEGMLAYNWNLITASTWLLTFVFAVLSNLLFPYVLFPWMATGALMPVAWLAIVRSDSGPSISALTLSLWGAIFTALGNILSSTGEQLKRYALPASLAAIPLLLIGSIIGLTHDNGLGFGLFLGAAIVLSVAHVFLKRAWLWILALGFGLVAYFTFFQLPIASSIKGYWCPQFAGATLLLLLPDMLLPSGKPLNIWRWPLRGWAIITGILALFSGLWFYFSGSSEQARAALFTLGLLGFLYLAYGIRMRQSWTGGLFSAFLTLSLVLGLNQYGIDSWLPILTGLAILFFSCGMLFGRLGLNGWSLAFRLSGLGLAGILSIAAFFYTGQGRALYVFVIASLFLLETVQTYWLEIIPPLIYSLSLGMAFFDARIEPSAYYSAGIACIFLIMDLLYFRLKKRGMFRWLTLFAGCLSAAITPVLVAINRFQPEVGLITCTWLTIIFLVQTLIYHKNRLGYLVTAYFSLMVLFGDLTFFPGHWLWSMIITAVLFYGLSFVIDRQKQTGWAAVLCVSGLGLASLTACSAPFEKSGLIASLPVAVAATLWAVEGFRRRNVWLGFPANGLYLMSYFLILATLRVDQAQFYSVGAAILGMVMHYLLVRTGSRTGAFLMGMFSQLVLIGTSYIQFVSTGGIWYFVVMFLQSLAVLGYGVVIRSRSLVITPIILVIIGVATVRFGALRGFSTVVLVGITGISLILLAIAALLLKERITDLRDQFKKWLP